MSDLTGARPPTPVASLHERVQRIIDLIRPAVQSDGGDLELVEVTPKAIRIRKRHLGLEDRRKANKKVATVG